MIELIHSFTQVTSIQLANTIYSSVSCWMNVPENCWQQKKSCWKVARQFARTSKKSNKCDKKCSYFLELESKQSHFCTTWLINLIILQIATCNCKEKSVSYFGRLKIHWYGKRLKLLILENVFIHPKCAKCSVCMRENWLLLWSAFALFAHSHERFIADRFYCLIYVWSGLAWQENVNDLL